MDVSVTAAQDAARMLPQIMTAVVTIGIIVAVTAIAVNVVRFIVNNMRPS